MSTVRASLRAVGLAAWTLLMLLPALLTIALAWPLAPLSSHLDLLGLRALLGLQTLWSRGLLVLLGVRLHVVGDRVRDLCATLLVSNHLGYLDVAVIAALLPCRFVAKSEIAGWPVFGFLSRLARVIFLDRGRRRDLVRVGDEIAHTLAAGVPVVVFPEGQPSCGETVLPFHPGLLEPAARSGAPCRALAIHYAASEGGPAPSHSICWWGDMTLLPHLWALMSIPRIDAHLRLSPRTLRGDERKSLAAALHAEVVAMFQPVRQEPRPAPSGERACAR